MRSTSGPSSLVVDEPQPLVICCCGFAPKPALSCDFASQQFSSLHVVSGAHVPRMCSALTGAACASSLTTWMQTTGATLLVVKRRSVVRAWMPAQDSRSAHGLLYLAAVRDDPRQQERCQGRVDIGPATLTAPEAVGR